MIQDHCSTPQISPDYITMTAALQQAKQPLKEIGGILSEKKKTPHRWPTCLNRTPPKVAFRNNNIYIVQKAEDKYCYEELQEPQEKNMKVFFINYK